MPNRPGLKFPSRNFARASKTLSNAPLSPKPSLPKSKAASPRPTSPKPASPVAVPIRAPSLAPSPVAAPAATAEAESIPENEVPAALKAVPEADSDAQVAAEVDAEAAPNTITQPEVSSMPEPKRPNRSRFTEEYLRPVLPSTRAVQWRAEPSRAEPSKAVPVGEPIQAVPASSQQPPAVTMETQTSILAGQQAMAVETQTSTVTGQIETDPSLPLHGFKRHTSLREPVMGIEQIYAHPRLGRPTADDVIATGQPHVAEPQRRATTDFMLEAAEEAELPNISAEQVSVEIDQANEDATAEVYEPDFVEDLAKTLSTGSDYEGIQQEAVMLNLDAEMAGLIGPEEDEEPAQHIMLGLDDEMDGLASSAAVEKDDAAPVLQGPDGPVFQDHTQAVDSTLESLTTAVADADTAHQAGLVDVAVAELSARVSHKQDEQEEVEIQTVVTTLTHQAEAAEEADQTATITSVVDSLSAQSADHYRRSNSLAVSEAIGGIQSAAVAHYQRNDSLAVSDALAGAQSAAAAHHQLQVLAAVDEALGGLVGDTQQITDLEQEAALGEPLRHRSSSTEQSLGLTRL